MRLNTIRTGYQGKKVCFSLLCILLAVGMAMHFPYMDIIKLFSPKEYVFLCLADLADSLPPEKTGVPSELTLSLSRDGKEILTLKSANDTDRQLFSCEALFGKGYVGIEKENDAAEQWKSMLLDAVQIKEAGDKSFGLPEGSGSILNTTVYELTVPEEASRQMISQWAKSAGDSDLNRFAGTAVQNLNSDVVMDLYIDRENKIIGACLTFTYDQYAVYAELLASDLEHPLNRLSFTCITEDGKGKGSTLYISSQGNHNFSSGSFSDETSLKFYNDAFLSATATASTAIQNQGGEGDVAGSFDAKIYGLNFKLSSAGSYQKENQTTFQMNCRIISQMDTLNIRLNYDENQESVRQVSFRSIGSVLRDHNFPDRLKNFLIGNNIAS